MLHFFAVLKNDCPPFLTIACFMEKPHSIIVKQK